MSYLNLIIVTYYYNVEILTTTRLHRMSTAISTAGYYEYNSMHNSVLIG